MFPMDDVKKWAAVYRLLDRVNTREFDCGTLCGQACCRCQKVPDDEAAAGGDELGIYLFPGEYRFLQQQQALDPAWAETEQLDPRELGFPDSWTEPVIFLHCKSAPDCPRQFRPLQCRTFPLKPVIGDMGVLEMIWNDEELPYSCPIIEQNLPVHDDFYKATYTVWTHLLKDRRIMDLVLAWSQEP